MKDEKQPTVASPIEHVVSSDLKNGLECDACGSTDTKQTYETINGYKQKVIVTHCDDCGLSLYREPKSC